MGATEGINRSAPFTSANTDRLKSSDRPDLARDEAEDQAYSVARVVIFTTRFVLRGLMPLA